MGLTLDYGYVARLQTAGWHEPKNSWGVTVSNAQGRTAFIPTPKDIAISLGKFIDAKVRITVEPDQPQEERGF